MPRTLRLASCLALLCAGPLVPALAAPPAPGDGDACLPRVVEGWLRSPPMPMPMMAGFARIENPCATAVAITGADSSAFERVELHETRVVDGVSRMRAVERLQVEAAGTTVLRPGGLHLMLMRPPAPLAAGSRARVDFILADGRRIGADFEVRAADAR